MRRKEIRLTLVYRDMWQSAGKYVPTASQLERVAPEIIRMGCFDRVETNGGGFEQVNLLFGENPNHCVRKWTKAFNETGIQTQMLERGLNGLRMNPVPADVRRLMFKVKKLQGTDIARSFDGLNNARNLALSFQYAREGGMIAQGALSLTVSPVHTVDYFVALADRFIELGAQEICLKDMAGIARPVSVGKIVKGIRERHPDILIHYHGHTTPGFSVASSLEAALNGADFIDVGMEPLSWGTGHADVLTIQAMLRDAGFSVREVDLKAYMNVRRLTQEFIDDFLGYYINPKNREINALLIGSGLPGGMMGSLMADLENNLSNLNNWLIKNQKKPLTQDDLFVKMLHEVEYVWPKLGYPPLVTPFSQYVKNVALMNVIQMEKGKERWSMIDENTWNMILGQQGQLPGPVDDEIKTLALSQGRTFYEGNPQDLYPDQLEDYRKKMVEKGWDTGPDDEELMEYAMHPTQYEAFRSGEAKRKFEEDLARRKELKSTPVKIQAMAHTNGKSNGYTNGSAETHPGTAPRILNLDINGEKFVVKIAYDTPEASSQTRQTEKPEQKMEAGDQKDTFITAPLEGKFFLTRQSGDKAIQIGDKVNKGDTVAFIESMKVINAIAAPQSGTVAEILVPHGTDVSEDDKLIKIV